MDNLSHSFLENQEECVGVCHFWPGPLTKGKEKSTGLFFCVMVFLGLLVTFTCRSELNIPGLRPKVHRPKLTPTFINTETRAHENTNKNKKKQKQVRKLGERNDSNARVPQLRVICDDQQKNATVSFASGTVRDPAAVRIGGGYLRKNAVPRHLRATCLMLIAVRWQNMCRTCFVLLMFLASALFAIRTSTRPRA